MYTEIFFQKNRDEIFIKLIKYDIDKVMISLQSLFPNARVVNKRNSGKSMIQLPPVDDLEKYRLTTVSIFKHLISKNHIIVRIHPGNNENNQYRDMKQYEKAKTIIKKYPIERINIIKNT